MAFDPQQALLNIANWALAKGKPRHHKRRYILGATCSTLGCFGLAAAYMVMIPPTFTSEWSMILPGAGAETRVALDRLGQAQSSSSSPFSDKTLSPKANYKEIAESYPVRADAARRVEIEPEELGAPKIKLVDQTSIMLVRINGPTPEEANRRAWALFEALRARLDSLRNDELKTKNEAVRNSILDVEVGLTQARQRLIELQSSTGLASLDQYNQIVASIETMRRDNAIAKATLSEKRSQVQSLRATLALSPEQAAILLQICADPELRKLAASYATGSAALAEMLQRFGISHPRAADQRLRLASLRQSIETIRPDAFAALPESALHRLAPSESERFLSLLSDLVGRNVELEGQIARVAELDASLAALEQRRDTLGAIAAKLDDLQRDHLIANAVFSSALARIDAGKSDQYASYPVLQMMSEPNMPGSASAPRFIFALLGAFGGSALCILGWTFAWLHQWFLFQRLERRLFRNLLPREQIA